MKGSLLIIIALAIQSCSLFTPSISLEVSNVEEISYDDAILNGDVYIDTVFVE